MPPHWGDNRISPSARLIVVAHGLVIPVAQLAKGVADDAGDDGAEDRHRDQCEQHVPHEPVGPVVGCWGEDILGCRNWGEYHTRTHTPKGAKIRMDILYQNELSTWSAKWHRSNVGSYVEVFSEVWYIEVVRHSAEIFALILSMLAPWS